MSGSRHICSDDWLLWNLHLSAFALPALTAADDSGVFEALAAAPATARELAERLSLNARAVRALLPLLAAEGVLVQRLGRYHLTEVARDFLLRSSPLYWGSILTIVRDFPMSHQHVMRALRAEENSRGWEALVNYGPAESWGKGSIQPAMARTIAAYMHANAMPAALVAAQRVDLGGARHLLDVGAGSGAFSIAFAQANPQLCCTLMDLQAMCSVATEHYVAQSGIADRISTCVVDMLRDPWPEGHDVLFFSNIFHDWTFEIGQALAAKAFAALPSGGRILVHEMLLNDTRDGPPVAVKFSFYMMLGTQGQQFTAAELSNMLFSAGFMHVEVIPCHGEFAVVSAEKPA